MPKGNTFTRNSDKLLYQAVIRHDYAYVKSHTARYKTIEDTEGNGALHWAVRTRDTKMVKILLAIVSDVDKQNHGGSTALHIATWNGDYDMAALLVRHGADVHLQDYDGNAPLHVAASLTPSSHQSIMYSRQAANIITLLREYGADIKATNRYGETVWDRAIENNTLIQKALSSEIKILAKETNQHTRQLSCSANNNRSRLASAPPIPRIHSLGNSR